MMGPIGSFVIVFTCTKSVARLVGVAPDVGLHELEEDSNVGNDKEDSSVENDEEDSVEYDEEGDNTGELGVVNGVVVVGLGSGVEREDEGSLGRVPSLTIK